MLLTVLLGLWVAGFLVLFRIPLCRKGGPRGEYPPISVIIPARDEEENLPRLLDSLREQVPPPDEILVVDDGSSDRTAEVAREKGATVIASRPLPEGWRGKSWACHQGAGAAAGDVLLFVDADTRFEPGGMGRMCDTFFAGRGALSLAPYHVTVRAYEQLSAFFNLMMIAGVGAFTVFGSSVRRAGLFGPLLMVDREDYGRAGGHEAVKDQVLENLFMAERFRAADVALRCRGGKETFCIRMYPHGLRDLAEGWTKAFAAGAARTPAWILCLTVLWLSGALTAVLACACAAFFDVPAAVLPGVYLLYVLQIAGMLGRIGSFSPWTSILYPVPLAFFFAVFARSAVLRVLGRNVSWKGRTTPSRSDVEPTGGTP